MLHIQFKSWKNKSNVKNARGALNASITQKRNKDAK